MSDEERLSEDQLNEVLFSQLVLMFQSAALQHMGKLLNPITQKVERDLQQAKGAIDMLGMLEARTAGNLNEREGKFLKRVLFELRMNYMDELGKPEPKKEEKAEEPQEAVREQPQEQAEPPKETAAPKPKTQARQKRAGRSPQKKPRAKRPAKRKTNQ